MYDVIIVGARCAGSPLAMLLARRGYRVLAVDRARFPSTALSTHLIQPPGVACLDRWGLLNDVVATGAACSHWCMNDFPGGRLAGPWHAVDGVDYTVNVRRAKLDQVLVDHASRAGAEIRAGVQVRRLLTEGDRVVGIEAFDPASGQTFRETARVVVGADGRRSFVARQVGARTYREVDSLTANFFMYVEDAQADRDVVEIFTRPPREYLFVPTDSGLTIANLVMSRCVYEDFRSNVEENFQAAFDLVPELGQRLRRSRQMSPVYGTAEVSNFYRQAYGPGWALVGDARKSRDPIRAQGMHEAFADVESLTDALDLGLSKQMPLDAALAEHERQQNRQTLQAYRLCLQAARHLSDGCQGSDRFMTAIRHDPTAIAAFRGLMAGSIAPAEFYQCVPRIPMAGTASPA